MISKILVANRGEIARRIFLACQELQIPSVAIYSEADADAPWTRLADERYPLKGVTASETYLDQEAVFAIAKLSGADAIHPGYGFLSENAEFAAACATHQIKFIGPPPTAMQKMASKAEARRIAEAAGVPIVPGVDGATMADDELFAEANKIGYPILIKASAGGGGKGMRVVWSADTFYDDLQAARQEGQSSFGDSRVIVEKYFTEIHHVEIQVLADEHGTVLHLFERECSIQRRHQKIVEESPSPIVERHDGLREQMSSAAVALAEAVGYHNAGTVEFIVDGEGGFYFLEMNTRLQVEHPVTEMVTGLDLAVWQIRIAQGEAFPFSQADLTQRGCAIECRLYAEDPAMNFLPSIGKIAVYERPSGPGIRIDDGIMSGSEVSPYYDPMLAKLITWGHTRAEAILKMQKALGEMVILGVTTNISYLLAIMQESHFQAGETSTNYLAQHFADWQPDGALNEDEVWVTAVLELLEAGGASRAVATNGESSQAHVDPWTTVKGWRG